jgi:hypothetical protein
VNRSEILIVRYRSTTVISISQDQTVSTVNCTETNDPQTVVDVQPDRKARLTSLQTRKLTGWASHLINRLFSR